MRRSQVVLDSFIACSASGSGPPVRFPDVGGGTYGFHLTYPGSPCVDKASNSGGPLGLPATDFEGDKGNPGRAINKTGATQYWCDMGADEVK